MVENVKIPKRIGAVKLSKKVRKKAKKAIKTAASPFVRDFATAAMAAASRVRHERGGEAREGQGGEREDYRMCSETRIHVDGAKVAEAFREAALDGFRRFLEGFEEGLRKAQAEEKAEREDSQPEPRAKPKATAGPKPRKPRATRPPPGAAPA